MNETIVQTDSPIAERGDAFTPSAGGLSSGEPVSVQTTATSSLNPATNEAGGVINLDQFRGDNRFSDVTGQGYSVVVLDTGIDLDHSAFGPDANNDGVADRIIYHRDFSGEGDGTVDDVHGHGTHVSSVVGSSNEGYMGIAPDVNIISLQVLQNNGSGSLFGIEQALQWVSDNADTYNIVAVNLSIGNSTNVNSNQTHSILGNEFQQLANQDIVTTVAAGNSYYTYQTEGVSSIAADPNVLPVGAVWDGDNGGVAWSSGARDFTTGADRLTSFSQRSDDIDMVFAPGAFITGAAPGGGARLAAGTSQATPVVTGMAVLAQQLADEHLGRRLTNEEFESLLIDSSETIFDGDDEDDNVINSNTTYDRVDMLALAEAIFEIGAQDDFGNTPGSAGLLAVNGAIAGEIEQAGDQDWFAVELEQGASYRFNMRGDSSDNGTLSDGILLIRDSEGSVLAYNNNSGIGTDARLSFTAEESGTFFLDARGVGDEIGTYVVDADLWSAPPPPPVGGDDDVGNTPETAGTLELGQELTGTIENKNDHDWFAVELEAGQNYRLIMRGEPSDGGTLADAYLALRDGDGDVLKSNNNSGIGTDARMSFTAEETGTHYLDAGAVGDHTGTYTVEARTWGTLPTPAGEESGSFEFASVSDEEEVSNSLDVFDL